jgi:hypothetical protein
MPLYLQTNSDGEKSQGYINSGLKEGIGAIAQYQILLYAICKKFNIKFYNSGFKNIGHSSYTNFDEEEWSNSFTKFFNFSTNKNIDDKIFFSKIDNQLFNFIEKNKNANHSILIKLDSESVLEYGQSIIQEIYKEKYLIGIKNNFIFNHRYFENDYLNLSFHIRNINSEDTSFQDFRELYSKDNTKYISIIKQLKNICVNEKVKLHIHSQGNEEDFFEFLNYQEKDFEIVLHLNDHPTSDIYHMSHSDLLVMANSSFSWIAHLMNYNVTLVRDNFWHSTYPNILKLDSNYSFDTSKLSIK